MNLVVPEFIGQMLKGTVVVNVRGTSGFLTAEEKEPTDASLSVMTDTRKEQSSCN